jgi:hypothetical protein
MSDSFVSQWDRILEVLIEKCRETLINSLAKRIVENITGFLTLFKDTTMAPTLYATKLRGLKLLSSLETKPENSEIVPNLKKGKTNCDEKWKIFITHKLATLLYLNYKNLKSLKNAEKMDALKGGLYQ